MDTNTAKKIFIQFMKGIDPATGEILPEDHLANDPLMQEAFLVALRSLPVQMETASAPRREGKTWVRKNGKLHAGRPWTEEDNILLLQMVEQGIPVEENARRMSRRVRGVNNQLAALRQKDDPRGSRRGKPWLPQEDDMLRWMAEEGNDIEEMARELRRSKVAIEYRLRHLGLIVDPIEME